eukprot:1195208-Prorocentrum_minimum.AAC.5
MLSRLICQINFNGGDLDLFLDNMHTYFEWLTWIGKVLDVIVEVQYVDHNHRVQHLKLFQPLRAIPTANLGRTRFAILALVFIVMGGWAVLSTVGADGFVRVDDAGVLLPRHVHQPGTSGCYLSVTQP